MASTKLKVKHIDSTGKKVNTEIFNCSSAINTNISSDTAIALDTWAKGFVSLSADSYDDCEITTTQSLNELVAQE